MSAQRARFPQWSPNLDLCSQMKQVQVWLMVISHASILATSNQCRGHFLFFGASLCIAVNTELGDRVLSLVENQHAAKRAVMPQGWLSSDGALIVSHITTDFLSPFLFEIWLGSIACLCS